MKEYEIKDGDTVIIDESLGCFAKSLCRKPYLALVLWKGIGGQPLIIESDGGPTWSCYEYIAEVVSHSDLKKLLGVPLTNLGSKIGKALIDNYEKRKKTDKRLRAVTKAIVSRLENETEMLTKEDYLFMKKLAEEELKRLEKK